MHRFAIAALGAAFLCGSALAADAPKKTLHELFDVLHDGGCTTIGKVREAGAVIELTPEQFQFVRAFWMAIPPISRTLPPGDRAFIARDAEETAVGLIDFDRRRRLRRLSDARLDAGPHRSDRPRRSRQAARAAALAAAREPFAPPAGRRPKGILMQLALIILVFVAGLTCGAWLLDFVMFG